MPNNALNIQGYKIKWALLGSHKYDASLLTCQGNKKPFKAGL